MTTKKRIALSLRPRGGRLPLTCSGEQTDWTVTMKRSERESVVVCSVWGVICLCCVVTSHTECTINQYYDNRKPPTSLQVFLT